MPLLESLSIGPGVAQWSVWSTTARVITTDPGQTRLAQDIVADVVAEVDLAASRFRPDSEVVRLAGAGGEPVTISPMLAELVGVALQAARDTNGAVDPTLGAPLAALGYDRSFETLEPVSKATLPQLNKPMVGSLPRPSWSQIRLEGLTLQVPAGLLLDLGATAKAWAADRSAHLVSHHLTCGALVALGGDIATNGPDPQQGWTILVQDGANEPASLVTLAPGRGLATSSTLGRAWARWNERMHHILDPVTCRPAPEVWRTVSVAAESCLAANVLTTASIVAGPHAVDLLRHSGAAARLVDAAGRIVTVNGWPT